MMFVFDLETIPDTDLIRSVLDLPEADEATLAEAANEQLAKNRNGFMPPLFQRVVAWVGLWVEDNGEPRQKMAWSGTDEAEGLRQLATALLMYKDFGLIHHNGKGFDLPVLTYRFMKHGLQLPRRLNHTDIKYRYSKANVDLVDEFSNYGASAWPKLKHLGQLIGIPVKQTGEGDDVVRMFTEGQLGQIERYCFEDVMGTYLVWLHLRYTVGELDGEAFESLKARALTKLIEIQSE